MSYMSAKQREIYKVRRSILLDKLRLMSDRGIFLAISNFEADCLPFVQESSFYYLTGVREPGTIFTMDIASGKTRIYQPVFQTARNVWVQGALQINDEHIQMLGVDEIVALGKPSVGYQCPPHFQKDVIDNFLADMTEVCQGGGNVFTLAPQDGHGYAFQRFILQRIFTLVPGMEQCCVDASESVHAMRRRKSNDEIEMLYKAIGITSDALEAVGRVNKVGKTEAEIQGLIEFVFTTEGAKVAFPSIVASGPNSTILHYHDNTKTIEKNDLIVIDVGARFNYYCADLTRTFPASGTFSKRQREVYMIVLETQAYIADLAKPGMYLSNAKEPGNSLHHLAHDYIKKAGYGDYFPHGIGHFLGIDVHDVGDRNVPLQAGDVFTIEPGIYIPQEGIGIRIEDDYWMTPQGAICLSEDLVKDPEDIEALAAQGQDLPEAPDRELSNDQDFLDVEH